MSFIHHEFTTQVVSSSALVTDQQWWSLTRCDAAPRNSVDAANKRR